MAFSSRNQKRKLDKQSKQQLVQINIQEIVDANADHFSISPEEVGEITKVMCNICRKPVSLHGQASHILNQHASGPTHQKKMNQLNADRAPADPDTGRIKPFALPQLTLPAGSKQPKVHMHILICLFCICCCCRYPMLLLVIQYRSKHKATLPCA